MTIKEMQDNVVGKYGLEAKETIMFFKLCDKLKEDNVVNNAILKLCHNSLLGIVDRERVEKNKIKEEENMKKAISLMIDNELNGTLKKKEEEI